MKDNAISYNSVHQQHPQHQPWNHQSRQQQTHSNMVYQNQSNSQGNVQQRSILPSHQQTNQQHHTSAQLDQYHQQLHSNAHHNSASAAAYYQQVNMYSPSYQPHSHSQDQNQSQQPQHSATEHQHSHQSGPNVPVTVPPTSVGVGHVHHQQNNTNTQTTTINHSGWSPNVASMTPQAHHPVVTDHSTIAYMGHPYQSHSTNVNDHHRGSNGSMSSQDPMTPVHQTSSYTVDTLYNTPSAAAAVAAAYGYNNYNAAFFQTSNNGPHTQTGHTPQPSLSTFWNHNQPSQQQRPAHSQTVTNQSSIQQRQPIVSEQGSNYIHNPQVYYGRTPYSQNLQNIGQNQHQAQPQSDVMHHRVSNLNHIHQIFPHTDQQLHQIPHQPSIQHPLGNHQQTSGSSMINHPTSNNVNQLTIKHNDTSPLNNHGAETKPPNTHSSVRHVSPIKQSSQATIHKPTSNEIDDKVRRSSHNKNLSEYDSSESKTNTKQSTQTSESSNDIASIKEVNLKHNPQQACNLTNPTGTKNYTSQNVIRAPDYKPPFVRPKIPLDTSSQPRPPPNRIQSEEKTKQSNDSIKSVKPIEKDTRPNVSEQNKNNAEDDGGNQNFSNALTSLEDRIGSLSVSSRKTTWASIASQPAKIIQPKSLKSKIAGSNSVLSSAKHLAVVSLDSSSIESKNGINPAIKSSVTSATTTTQRSSMPPPISKLPAVAASLKLNLLGESMGDNAKISWPAMNASAAREKEINMQEKQNHIEDNTKRLNDDVANDDSKEKHVVDTHYKDHNHNHGFDTISSHQVSEENHVREPWNRRADNTYRPTRDSDQDAPNEYKGDLRDVLNSRREFRNNQSGPHRTMGNNFRERDDQYRERGPIKRGAPIIERNRAPMRVNDNYQTGSRFQQLSRYDARDSHNDRHNDDAHSYEPSFRERENRDRREDHSPANLNEPMSPKGDDFSTILNQNNYNPKNFDLELNDARYFIIKSYSGDDIHRSIKYSIWCSTNHGNKKLDEAFRQQQAKNAPIYLFFSVNSSGHFCGVAQMTTPVDFDSSTGVWAQSKWQGEFSVKWIYVKNVPNNVLRHITLENNEDKPVTNSRDTQEVTSEKGKSVLKILHQYPHTSSIFDQYQHYERRQEEDRLKRSSGERPSAGPDHRPIVNNGRPHRSNEDMRDRDRVGGPSGPRFGGRPYNMPRPHNDYQGNHRGAGDGRMNPPHSRLGAGPHMDRTPHRENGGSAIKLTQ